MGKTYFLKRLLIAFVVTIFFMNFSIAQAQENKVTGKVVSAEDGMGLPGVNVMIKGKTTGTITNIDGIFELNTQTSDTLLFSYIGYNTEEIAVNSQGNIDVSLIVDAESLSEVVVIGYGTVKKSHLTGSVSKLKNEKLDQEAVSRVDEALLGKMSGVNVSMGNAGVGQAPTITVRGNSSITSDSDPLVVVDGIPVSSDFLTSLNMNDVESFEVLKDAASASIYGSRGAAGVIMITTKKGRVGKTTFSFNTFAGTKSAVSTDSPVPTVGEWASWVRSEGAPLDVVNTIESFGTEQNWAETMFDGGSIQSYNLSASGGSEKFTFMASGGYLKDEGVMLTDEFEKFNLRLNGDVKVNKVIEVGFTASPSYTNTRRFPIGVHDAIRQSPWLPIYHDENTLATIQNDDFIGELNVGDYAMERHFSTQDKDDPNYFPTTSNANAYAKVVEREYRDYDFNLLSSAYMQLNIYKDLKFKSVISTEYLNRNTEEWNGTKAHRKGASEAESSYDTRTYSHWVSENYFMYNKTVGSSDFNAVAGFSAEKQNLAESGITATGYDFDYVRTTDGFEISDAGNTKHSSTLASVYGRLNYAYNNKYLAMASYRYDGSSRFGTDTKWGGFPAVSVGWRMGQEDFLKDNSYISEAKLRASYGQNGKNAGGYYDQLGLVSPTSAVLNGGLAAGFYPSQGANPNLRWQKSVETNIGFDFGMYKNRIFLSGEFYNKSSEDLLLDQPTSTITGYESALVNLGKVDNKGIELDLTTRNISTADFKWNTTVTFSKNKSTLVDFAGADSTISNVESKRPFDFIAIEGENIINYWGYEASGEIDKKYIKDPYYPIGANAQDTYVVDQNNDGVIDEDDKVILGNPDPDFIWAMTNNFTYKNFDLSFTFQGSHGAEIVNMDRQYLENLFAGNMDYINDAADPNFFPDADMVVQKIYTDYLVQDASYIALRNLNFGYTLPQATANKIGLSRARVYLAAQNLLFMWSDEYTSYNPEGQFINDDMTPLTRGYQKGSAPIARTITVGLNLDF